MVAAIVALAAAIALVATRSRYRGMALPLAVIGLGELALGAGLWARTDAQVATLLAPFAALLRPATLLGSAIQ